MKEIIYDYEYHTNMNDYFKCFSKDELLERFDVDSLDDISDDKKYDDYSDYLYMNYHDHLNDLDLNLDNDIIVFGDIGTWRGTLHGYKELGDNLNDIINDFNCDSYCLYSNGYNVLFEGADHDGSSYLLLRKWKKNITDEQKERFFERLYNGNEISRRAISYYTESLLPFVSKIYGNKCHKRVLNSVLKGALK